MVLYFGKSAVNPLIYGWKNTELRRALLRLLQRRRGRRLLRRRASTAVSFIDLGGSASAWHSGAPKPRRSQSHRPASSSASSKLSFLRLKRCRTVDLTETAAQLRSSSRATASTAVLTVSRAVQVTPSEEREQRKMNVSV